MDYGGLLSLGGYAAFVWTGVGLAVAGLVWMIYDEVRKRPPVKYFWYVPFVLGVLIGLTAPGRLSESSGDYYPFLDVLAITGCSLSALFLLVYWLMRTSEHWEMVLQLRKLLLDASKGGNAIDANALVARYEGLRRGLLRHRARFPVLEGLKHIDLLSSAASAESKFQQIADMVRPILENRRIPTAAVVPSGASMVERQAEGGRGNVFIVHGHDEGMKQAVARFVEKLGMKATVLHEQADAGRTLIEKFEENTDVDYAVVLLSPDDVGHVERNPAGARPRARQNVLFELGYFCAKLGRDRTCLLVKGEVEIPSDLHGVLHTSYENGEWRTDLARNMKAAGLHVDMNKAL